MNAISIGISLLIMISLPMCDFSELAWTLSNSRRMFARGGSHRIGWSIWS